MEEQIALVQRTVLVATIASCLVAGAGTALVMWFNNVVRRRTSMLFLLSSLTVICLVAVYLFSSFVMYATIDRIPHLFAPDYFIVDSNSGQIKYWVHPTPTAWLYPLITMGIIVMAFVLRPRRQHNVFVKEA